MKTGIFFGFRELITEFITVISVQNIVFMNVFIISLCCTYFYLKE